MPPILPDVDPLGALLQIGAANQRCDADLLARYVAGAGRDDAGSEAAFAVLVARHGPMVLGVCRRVLGGDPHAAADAFQATFLTLVRKAPAVRVEDSLGRWLHGVSVRVARQARARILRDRARAGSLAAVDPAAPEPGGPGDVAATLDVEVARLPGPLRAAIVLCDLEGLTHDQAARRLRCAVGTVHSRVHRARRRLRAALERRGLAAPLAPTLARVEVPAALIAATARLAGAARPGSGAASSALIPLIRFFGREWFMVPAWMPGLAGLALTVAAATAVAPIVLGTLEPDDPPAPTPAAAAAARPQDPDPAAAPKPGPTVAERFARFREEYRALEAAWRAARNRAATPDEQAEIDGKLEPDLVGFCRRMVDLAQTSPAETGSRDALLWVLGQVQCADMGPYGDEFARASALLLRHHGDDPRAVRIGLALSGIRTFHRDALLTGLMSTARGPESRGLARLAMAQYLERKAQDAAGARKRPGRGKVQFDEWLDLKGTQTRLKVVDEGDEQYAYRLALRGVDPEYFTAEAERLYEEVVRDYGSIRLNAGETLGHRAAGRLDALRTIGVGKPAPAIEGMDLDGRPLRLADLRGKVVVLFFWTSGDGPALRERRAAAALAGKHKAAPFAVVGVNCDRDPGLAQATARDEALPWASWADPVTDVGLGPIAARYHIDHLPVSFLLDGDGVIREVGVQTLDNAAARIEALLAAPR